MLLSVVIGNFNVIIEQLQCKHETICYYLARLKSYFDQKISSIVFHFKKIILKNFVVIDEKCAC